MPEAIDKSSACNFLQVGAGIRNWAEETSSAHLFSGKVFVDNNMIHIDIIKAIVIIDTNNIDTNIIKTIIIIHKAIVKDNISTNTTTNILRSHHY